MPYTSDARVQVDERHYFYPDVTVACGEQDEKTLKNPVLVIEVLSPSTEKRDRGAKFKAYKRLPSLQEYVLIGSESKTIEVYRREGAFWKQCDYQEGDTIELTSLGVRFSFERVYRGIRIL
jgi:Uma2 family endonuclease